MKRYFLIFVLVIFSIGLFPTSVSGETNKCVDIGVSYAPTFLPEDNARTEIPITVNIPNEIIENIEGSTIRLEYGFRAIGDPYKTEGIVVSKGTNSYPFVIKKDNAGFNSNSDLFAAGSHSGSLHYQPPGQNDQEFCSHVDYTIGVESGAFNQAGCKIDPNFPKEIPPRPFSFSFQGKGNTEYSLFYGKGAFSLADTNFKATTRADGYGIFNNVSLSASPGDKILISIKGAGAAGCFMEVTINPRATVAPPPNPAPEVNPFIPNPNNRTANSAGRLCDPAANTCTRAGGSICHIDTGTITLRNQPPPLDKQGIQTAIGCVPIDPKAFIEKSLPVAFGASGGVAFLLMIFGAFQMITSAGNPDNVKKGREQFNSAIIGLVFILFSVLLLEVVGFNILNIPGFGR